MKIRKCCEERGEDSLSKFPEQTATHLQSLSIPHPVHLENPVHPVDSSSLQSVQAQQFQQALRIAAEIDQVHGHRRLANLDKREF